MKGNIFVGIFALVFAILVGCDSQAENTQVGIAMSSLEKEMNKTFQSPNSQSDRLFSIIGCL